MWGRGEYGRLGLGDRSGSSKLRATQVHFREPETRIVQVRTSAQKPLPEEPRDGPDEVLSVKPVVQTWHCEVT